MAWPNRTAARPWVYGHRGLREGVAENTLFAFQAAIASGADGVELDVCLNRDGECIVFHDASLERMTGGRDRRLVFDVAWSELASVELLHSGKIPRLKDVLLWANSNQGLLNIELKTGCYGAEELSAIVLQELRDCATESLQRRTVLSSFSSEIVRWLLVHHAAQPVAHLVDEGHDPLSVELPQPVGVHPKYTMLDAHYNSSVRSRYGFVNVWTLNDAFVARQLAPCVDGIITDHPGDILRALTSS